MFFKIVISFHYLMRLVNIYPTRRDRTTSSATDRSVRRLKRLRHQASSSVTQFRRHSDTVPHLMKVIQEFKYPTQRGKTTNIRSIKKSIK